MRVLLDECIPRQLKTYFTPEHECNTVPEAGFAGKTNGELLALAEGLYDVFVTLDKGIRYQQNLDGKGIAIVLIRSKSSRLADIAIHSDECLKAIRTIGRGEVVQTGEEP
jgi:predicted nuclease of predicted toxin-antitoxin system